MPELPDVEHFRRIFAEHAMGRVIDSVSANETILRNSDPRRLNRALRGHRFAEPGRHGKWLIGWTNGPALLLHFGMTGDLIWSDHEPDRHRHDRMVLSFRDGHELRYRNMRKLGGVWLAERRDEVATLLRSLGPDALAVDRAALFGLLARRWGQVKAALMDQSFVSGVGNILADEILWQARLHPKRRIETLSRTEKSHLHRHMHGTLRAAVDGYDFLPSRRDWLSYARGRKGATCPRCGAELIRILAAGRTTYLCPRCQAEP